VALLVTAIVINANAATNIGANAFIITATSLHANNASSATCIAAAASHDYAAGAGYAPTNTSVAATRSYAD
jgi:hypothetical protein